MEMTHKSASIWIFSLHLLLVFDLPVCDSLVFFLVFFYFFLYVEKLLTLTLETLGSKEVARWLVWLQNTKEHG